MPYGIDYPWYHLFALTYLRMLNLFPRSFLFNNLEFFKFFYNFISSGTGNIEHFLNIK